MGRQYTRLTNTLRLLKAEYEDQVEELPPVIKQAYRAKLKQNTVGIWDDMKALHTASEVIICRELSQAIQHVRNALNELERDKNTPPDLSLKPSRF